MNIGYACMTMGVPNINVKLNNMEEDYYEPVKKRMD